MVYNRFSLSVILHLFLLVILSFANGMLYMKNHDLNFLVFLTIICLILAGSLVYTVSRANRSLAYFFEAIQNDDASIHFPEPVPEKSFRTLHKNLNRLNEMIGDLRRQSAIQEKYYQALIRHSATGLISMNQSGDVEIINEKACEYAGVPVESNPSMIKKRNNEFCKILVSIQAGETMLYRINRNNRLYHLSVRATEIRFGNRTSKLISLQDIRQEMNEQEIDAWQKLIRVLTHEIMNSVAPITSLTATLRKFFLKNGLPIPPEEVNETVITNTIHGIETIEERGKGLLNFVNSYRKLTKIPQPVFASIQLESWLDSLRMLMLPKMEEAQVNFEIIPSRIQQLSADPNLLSQVMINILNNAIEALKEKEGGRKISVSVERDISQRITLRIKNNGPRIMPELREKIFIPFFTTRENGSGIGLSLSQQILSLHGGFIDVESNDSSTSFILTL